MRVIIFATFAISLGLLTACHKRGSQATGQQRVISASATLPPPARPQCYAHATGKDTVRLTLQTTQPTVTGRLAYRYFEKDRSQGTIAGTMHGDTLLANYTFQAEGTTSVRQVAFVRQGAGFAEGYGDVAERTGQTVFAHPHALHFDSQNPLLPVACPR